jgi:hypothetical protein
MPAGSSLFGGDWMKLVCKCGQSIRDQQDRLYKGTIIKDQDYQVKENIRKDLCDYIEAIRSRQEKQHPELRKADAIKIVSIMSMHEIKYKILIYECQGCGRLWVGKNTKSKEFVSYLPEDPGSIGILTSEYAGTKA